MMMMMMMMMMMRHHAAAAAGLGAVRGAEPCTEPGEGEGCCPRAEVLIQATVTLKQATSDPHSKNMHGCADACERG